MSQVPINIPKLSLIQSMHQGKTNKQSFSMSQGPIYEPGSNLRGRLYFFHEKSLLYWDPSNHRALSTHVYSMKINMKQKFFSLRILRVRPLEPR